MCAHDHVGTTRVMGRAHADGVVAGSGEGGRQGAGGNDTTSEDSKGYIHGNNTAKDDKEAVEGHEERHGWPADGRHHMQI
jgi:hypothetical protein